LIREQNVISVNECFASPVKEADIENLLDPDIFDQLVKEKYAKELEGKTLVLNPKIPRIVKRYEDAFGKLGLQFNKTVPARLFLRRMAEKPETLIPSHVKDRFEHLFKIITARLNKLLNRDSKPFD
jgi:hypothetical protein